MKKAQIEIVGLVIIVIILVFSAIIFLRIYLASNPSTSLDESLLLTQKANNLANSIKGVDVCNSNMAQAIVFCCSAESFCGRDACSFVSGEIAKIVNLTLSGEKVSVELKDRDGKTCASYGNGKCTSGFVAASPSPIKGVSGEAEIYINMCKK